MWDETLSCGNYYPREERILGQNVVGLFAIGTKCSWDLWFLGQNVFGTIHFFLGQICIGTKGIGTKCPWDNFPTGNMSLGQFT